MTKQEILACLGSGETVIRQACNCQAQTIEASTLVSLGRTSYWKYKNFEFNPTVFNDTYTWSIVPYRHIELCS